MSHNRTPWNILCQPMRQLIPQEKDLQKYVSDNVKATTPRGNSFKNNVRSSNPFQNMRHPMWYIWPQERTRCNCFCRAMCQIRPQGGTHYKTLCWPMWQIYLQGETPCEYLCHPLWQLRPQGVTYFKKKASSWVTPFKILIIPCVIYGTKSEPLEKLCQTTWQIWHQQGTTLKYLFLQVEPLKTIYYPMRQLRPQEGIPCKFLHHHIWQLPQL